MDAFETNLARLEEHHRGLHLVGGDIDQAERGIVAGGPDGVLEDLVDAHDAERTRFPGDADILGALGAGSLVLAADCSGAGLLSALAFRAIALGGSNNPHA